MSEIVERVAKAIAVATLDLYREPQLDTVEFSKRWETAARAAIEAMREPTAGMIDKALIVNLKPSPDRSCSTYLYDEEAREIWGMQIDEALK